MGSRKIGGDFEKSIFLEITYEKRYSKIVLFRECIPEGEFFSYYLFFFNMRLVILAL